MGTMQLPLEVFDLLVERLGREDALKVSQSIEASLEHVAERSKEIAAQRKLEAKDELRVELLNELATKADIVRLEHSTKADIARLEGATKADMARLEGTVKLELAKQDKKFTTYFVVLLIAFFVTNMETMKFVLNVLGLIK